VTFDITLLLRPNECRNSFNPNVGLNDSVENKDLRQSFVDPIQSRYEEITSHLKNFHVFCN
jgi:hypothetical protein